MPNTPLSKTAKVLQYFSQQYQVPKRNKGIERTRLMKMAYLSDLLAREYLGRPITDFNYYLYKFGPYDDAIEEAVAELVAAGVGDAKEEWDGEYESRRLLPVRSVEFDFTLGEMELLRYVSKTYLSMPMKELLFDVVYRTRPMEKKDEMKWKDALPMAASDGRGVEAVGFDLEEMLRAEQEIESGHFAMDF